MKKISPAIQIIQNMGTLTETEIEFVFNGSAHCFTYLDKDIVHQRKVVKTKGEPIWVWRMESPESRTR